VPAHDDPDRRLGGPHALQDRPLVHGRLIEDDDPRCLLRNGVLERGAIQISANDPDASILAQNPPQAMSHQRIEAPEHNGDTPGAVVGQLAHGAGRDADCGQIAQRMRAIGVSRRAHA
jgi:hypothetical protein